jgi:hypothetical protein
MSLQPWKREMFTTNVDILVPEKQNAAVHENLVDH